ncbi:hypothetical protein CASFOL_040725 [Castilleja foliolosa]|uniref:Uncharacterized protein n=1 Tax=Castilleja foliolosa TaxID=1961234 RepID=A0ABD3BD28_9LAMI
MRLDSLRVVVSNNRRNRDKYCRYHRDYGHDTNDCYNLKNLIEAIIRRGQLANYVRRENQERRGRNREDEGAILACAFAEKDYQKATAAAARVLQMGFVLGLSLALFVGLGLQFGSGIFTKDQSDIHMIAIGIPFVAATQPINSLAFVFDGIDSSSQAFARTTFSNSLGKIDMGPCPRVHSLQLRKEYEEAKAKGLDNYDRDLEDTIDRLIVECDRKISRALKRLDDEDAKAAIAISVSEVTQTEETNELSKQIKEKLKEIDQFIVPHQLRSAIDKQSLLYLTLKNDGKIVVNNASEVASTTSYQSTGNLPGTSTFTPTTPVPKSSTSKRQFPESPGQDKKMKRA